MKKSKSTKKIAVLLAAIVSLSFILASCGFLQVKVSGIKFKVDSIALQVGEERDISSQVVEVYPTWADEKGFTLTSSESGILYINTANRITALAAGEVTLTATATGNKAFTDTCTVVVTYASVKDISIESTGSLVQTLGKLSAVTFTPKFSSVIDPKSQVTWEVDGERFLKRAEDNFIYTPEDFGSHIIKASVTNDAGTTFSAQSVVKVYKPFVSPPTISYSGNLSQEISAFIPVEITVNYENIEGNPPPTFQWFINDKESVNNTATISFSADNPGIYEIRATVNGTAAKFNDADFIVIKGRGQLVPKNVYLDYDNSYPKLYVRWDALPASVGYKVKIIDRATSREVSTELSTQNDATKALFGENCVEVSSIIGTSSQNIFDKTYSISVQTLGDGDVYEDSDFSQAYLTAKIPVAAKPYLAKKYMDGARNYYLTDDNEYYNMFVDAMLWDKTNLEMYMAYDYGSAEAIKDKAFKSVGFTGEYRIGTEATSRDGKIVSLIIYYDTDNTPTNTTRGISPLGLGAMRPHVNYDSDKALKDDYVFPIDKRTISVNVQTTDQLFYVAQLGYKPVPTVNSRAATYYNYAKRMLKSILTEDMSEVEKAHAIYDWIMWRVTYDTPSTELSSLAQSVKHKAYYIEGVLTDSEFFAVCDGMSKAYALLANMVGLDCVRVVGDAGRNGNTGGHAWNKVRIGSEWYIVDCTWGQSEQLVGTTSKELEGHSYFLLTDEEVKNTHFENNSAIYPRTPSKPYNFFNTKFIYNDNEIDYYIDSTGAAQTRELDNLIDYVLQTKPSSRTYVVGPDAEIASNQTNTGFYAFDIKIDKAIYSSFTTMQSNPLLSAFARANLHYSQFFNITDYLVYLDSYDQTVMIVIKM